MLGISYGEWLVIIGATAVFIKPKDLPAIARTAGRLAGRAIGNFQVARGQFESIMQQSQAHQVHKELQETMAQLEAIRHEIRSVSFMNPGPLTTRLVDKVANQPPPTNVEKESPQPTQESNVRVESTVSSNMTKVKDSTNLSMSDMHSQASAYARLAESAPLTANSMGEVLNEMKDESGQFVVLPISAETAKLLPSQKADLRGSDLVLEAILEEEVARTARDFFTQAQNQTKK